MIQAELTGSEQKKAGDLAGFFIYRIKVLTCAYGRSSYVQRCEPPCFSHACAHPCARRRSGLPCFSSVCLRPSWPRPSFHASSLLPLSSLHDEVETLDRIPMETASPASRPDWPAGNTQRPTKSKSRATDREYRMQEMCVQYSFTLTGSCDITSKTASQLAG